MRLYLVSLVLVTSQLVAGGSVCPRGMLWAPGTFGEGAEAEGASLAGFCLDTTEVTVADYRRCVDGGDCPQPPETVAGSDIPTPDVPVWSRSCNAHRDRRGRHPINCVDFGGAEAYCAAVGKRLPTEAEWEWAATGGDEGRLYPWGGRRPTAEHLNVCDFDCLDRLRAMGRPRPTMHYGEDGFAETAPVGSFPAGVGRWGHLDLAGNVWEFTASAFAGDERLRVIRGGGWAQSNRGMIETTYRAGYLTTARGSAVGFRCAAEPAKARGR